MAELDRCSSMFHTNREETSADQQTLSTMSQWLRVQHNQHVFDQMLQYYPPHFPIEVRYYLYQWIDAQPWSEISESNIQHAEVTETLLNEMLELLQQKINELGDDFFLIKVNLGEAFNKIQTIMRTKPQEMIETIKNCLAREEMLLTQSEVATQQDQMNESLPDADHQINEAIRTEILRLSNITQCTDDELKSLQDKQESFIIKFSDTHKILDQISQYSKQKDSPEKAQKVNQLKTQKEQIDMALTLLAHELLLTRNELSKKYKQTVVDLQKLQKEIVDNKLTAWKRKQQLAENGMPLPKSELGSLRQWCDDLTDLIWKNRQQIKKFTHLQKQLPIKLPDSKEDDLPELNECITSLLSSLVTSTFIVEQQPPQILKKDARFSATVSLLVGGKLNVHMNPPQVKATIISERQAGELLKPSSELKAKNCNSGEILNNTGTMEYQPKTGHLGITFKNMQLKKITRTDKRGSEVVTEEKFCILFQSDFNVGGNELIFQVWTLSLPVVVTVHGNQECSAAATILWDNAFAEPGRTSFAVPDHVEWPLLAEQLSRKFKSQTGKELSTSNLAYVASKLFRSKDLSNMKVTWAQFYKDVLSKRSYTFWGWFYAVQKLTKEHLRDLWIDDTIIGFVSKNKAQKLLADQPQGTFLMRFSDSEIGGITIAWTGEKEVLHLAPFTAKDINIRKVANRIRDLNNLVTLYPNRPKDLVFSKYYTQTVENMTSEGYVKTDLKTTISEEFKPATDTEIKQPYSQESFYDSGLSSVQSMDGTFPITLAEYPVEFMQMDITQFTDYMPENIDQINDIMSEELIG